MTRSPPSTVLHAPTDPRVQSVHVLGTSVGCTTEGEPRLPALLMVHGVPGGSRDFRYLAPYLSEHFLVHRLELPGFGGSAERASWGDYSPEGRARLIDAAATALGLKTYAILGHSMGGPAAIAAASMFPDRVRGLVAVASVGPRRHKGLVLGVAAVRRLSAALSIPGLRVLMTLLNNQIYRSIGFPAGFSTAELLAHAAVIGSTDFQKIQASAAQVACPALVAWAEDDRLIEAEISCELHELIPGAASAVYPTGGHNIQKTQAAALAAEICRVLTG